MTLATAQSTEFLKAYQKFIGLDWIILVEPVPYYLNGVHRSSVNGIQNRHFIKLEREQIPRDLRNFYRATLQIRDFYSHCSEKRSY